MLAGNLLVRECQKQKIVVSFMHLPNGPQSRFDGTADQQLSRSGFPVLARTRTCHNVRYPVAMEWSADLEEAVRNKLNL